MLNIQKFYGPDTEGAGQVESAPVQESQVPAQEQAVEAPVETAPAKPKEPLVPLHRVQKLTAQLMQERAESDRLRNEEARLKRELAAQVGWGEQEQEQAQIPLEEQIEHRAHELANHRLNEQQFLEACNSEHNKGMSLYGDEFQNRIDSLRVLNVTNSAAFNNMLKAALATGEAAQVMYKLGDDVDQAERIMQLEPVKMAVELTKLAAKVSDKGTKAPKPITPVTARTSGGGLDGQASDPTWAMSQSVDAWMERRAREVQKRRR